MSFDIGQLSGDYSKKFEMMPNIEISVEGTHFSSELNTPKDRRNAFVYFMSVINNGARTIRLLGRKWIVSEFSGKSYITEGVGVIGKQPILKSGEFFRYCSYHVVATQAEASGAYFFEYYKKNAKNNKIYYCEIPPFSLRAPFGAYF